MNQAVLQLIMSLIGTFGFSLLSICIVISASLKIDFTYRDKIQKIAYFYAISEKI